MQIRPWDEGREARDEKRERPRGRKAGGRKRPASPPPDELEFEQLQDLQRWAAREVPSQQARVPELVAACLDHFRAKGEVRADWVATARNWIRKAAEYAKDRPNGARAGDRTAEAEIREIFDGARRGFRA